MRFKEYLTRELTPNDGASYYLDGTAQGMKRVRMYVYLTRRYNEKPANLQIAVTDLTNVFKEPIDITQKMVDGFFNTKMAV